MWCRAIRVRSSLQRRKIVSNHIYRGGNSAVGMPIAKRKSNANSTIKQAGSAGRAVFHSAISGAH
jgi:hypothetical protein